METFSALLTKWSVTRKMFRGIHRSPVNSSHKGQWRGALMLSLICAWIKGWVNNREAGDLRRHRAHYDVIVMFQSLTLTYSACRLPGSYICKATTVIVINDFSRNFAINYFEYASADQTLYMMTSMDGNTFRVTDPLWGESTGHRWIPFTKSL